MFVSEIHLLKAKKPIFVTLFGIIIFVSRIHSLNEYSSISVTLYGIVIVLRDKHPENNLKLIFTILAEKSKCFSS